MNNGCHVVDARNRKPKHNKIALLHHDAFSKTFQQDHDGNEILSESSL